MKTTSLFALLFAMTGLAPVIIAAPDPFGNATPDWLQTLRIEKPLVLQICTLEVDAAQKPAFVRPSDEGWIVTPAFLAAALRLEIATSGADSGLANLPGKLEAAYRLESTPAGHSVSLRLRLSGDGAKAEINSDMVITDKWTVLGGLSRTVVSPLNAATPSETRERIVALRLVPEEQIR